MKADLTLSTVSRRLRPSPRRFRAQSAYLRPYSHFAASGHPIVPNRLRAVTATRFAHPSRYPFTTFQACRQSTTATPSSVPTAPESPPEAPSENQPAYELTFTCKPCSHRSTHNISKQGYHKGTVLITCPDCKNRHLISDHLKIFEDKSVTIEDLMREKGQLVKRGHLNGQGDVEFWNDGTNTERRVDASQ